ncbi:uncharacterized protein BO95DRAFT_441177 [Aspergillus brunneoviolaceus CBS 621.78]|uniref:Uncharacterized protein n=1 Tax=Aspergillus brunneoviolaceus CBS 621.78 TaxID=1450534 RepID=A0ACD1GEB3_9EURO|nr:hypothetical protein BO95DRAFT_441177 [Aspergillus brunneoviolaceus CBS 621.78]RAH47655.1 hypothetical protein BO95DRAFT_441177 [Aspergillus brunneoviolaceus CBS 621.78]
MLQDCLKNCLNVKEKWTVGALRGYSGIFVCLGSVGRTAVVVTYCMNSTKYCTYCIQIRSAAERKYRLKFCVRYRY